MSEAMEGRLRDQSVEERAPTLSGGGKDPTDSGSVLTLPVVPVSRTRSHISRYEHTDPSFPADSIRASSYARPRCDPHIPLVDPHPSP